MVVIGYVSLFADLIPFLNHLEPFLTCDHYGELFEKVIVEFLSIFRGVLINPLAFSSGVHTFESFKHNLSPFLTYLTFGYQEISLKVIEVDNSIIVDCHVHTCKDKIFSQLSIYSIGRWDKNTKSKKSS